MHKSSSLPVLLRSHPRLETIYWPLTPKCVSLGHWLLNTDRIFELEYRYRLNTLCWNIPADWIFYTGMSLLTEYFVLDILTDYFFCADLPQPIPGTKIKGKAPSSNASSGG
jgi:hypothetical protein